MFGLMTMTSHIPQFKPQAAKADSKGLRSRMIERGPYDHVVEFTGTWMMRVLAAGFPVISALCAARLSFAPLLLLFGFSYLAAFIVFTLLVVLGKYLGFIGKNVLDHKGPVFESPAMAAARRMVAERPPVSELIGDPEVMEATVSCSTRPLSVDSASAQSASGAADAHPAANPVEVHKVKTSTGRVVTYRIVDHKPDARG